MLILKLLSLFIALWYSMVFLGKLYRGHNISVMTLVVLSISIVSFIYSMGWL